MLYRDRCGKGVEMVYCLALMGEVGRLVKQWVARYEYFINNVEPANQWRTVKEDCGGGR